MPVPEPTEVAQQQEPIAWEPAIGAAVAAAAVNLETRLHNLTLTLAKVRDLKVGDVLALDGCTVASARLCAVDGRLVARARLGQSGGMRAVRIEAPPALDMRDLPVTAGSGMPMVAMSDAATAAINDMEGTTGFASVDGLPAGGD